MDTKSKEEITKTIKWCRSFINHSEIYGGVMKIEITEQEFEAMKSIVEYLDDDHKEWLKNVSDGTVQSPDDHIGYDVDLLESVVWRLKHGIERSLECSLEQE